MPQALHLVEKRAYDRKYYQKNSVHIQAQRRVLKNKTVRGRMLALAGNAKQRSKRIGWSYNLSVDFLCALWEEQRGLCAITKMPLSLEKEDSRWNSSLVSLDRIDSSKGYLQDNVWLVTSKINYAKGTQTYEEFVGMCKEVVEGSGEGA